MTLRRFLLLSAVLAWCGRDGVRAQTYTLGTPADPCVGGTPYTMSATGASMRFGDFTCSLPVTADGLHTVTLTFQEPCPAVTIPGCTALTAPKQRMENVYVNDPQVLAALDPYAAGSAGAQPVMRSTLAYSEGGKIRVRIQTVLGSPPNGRAGVLSSVAITPGLGTGSSGPSRLWLTAGSPPANTTVDGVTYDGVVYLDADLVLKVLRKDGSVQLLPQLARAACQGKFATHDCTAIEIWTLRTASGAKTYAGVSDSDPGFVGLQPCPPKDPTKACWAPIQ